VGATASDIRRLIGEALERAGYSKTKGRSNAYVREIAEGFHVSVMFGVNNHSTFVLLDVVIGLLSSKLSDRMAAFEASATDTRAFFVGMDEIEGVKQYWGGVFPYLNKPLDGDDIAARVLASLEKFAIPFCLQFADDERLLAVLKRYAENMLSVHPILVMDAKKKLALLTNH
jgi:hypothetical protein